MFQSDLDLLSLSCVTTVTPGKLPITISRDTATLESKVDILQREENLIRS